MLNVVLCEFVLLEEAINLVEACIDGILALEGTFAEEHLEDAWLLNSTSLPLSIAHRDLVEISQKRIVPVVCLLLFAILAGFDSVSVLLIMFDVSGGARLSLLGAINDCLVLLTLHVDLLTQLCDKFI